MGHKQYLNSQTQVISPVFFKKLPDYQTTGNNWRYFGCLINNCQDQCLIFVYRFLLIDVTVHYDEHPNLGSFHHNVP